MGINSTDTAYNFGQLGSGYLDDTGALTPPTGKVIVAITVLDNATKFALLTADDAQGNDAAFIGTATQVTGNGANSEPIDTATTFDSGLTIFGRWTACTLGAGSVICYYGE